MEVMREEEKRIAMVKKKLSMARTDEDMNSRLPATVGSAAAGAHSFASLDMVMMAVA